MELEEAIEDVKKYISFANKEENFSSTFEFNWHKDLANRIDIILKELDKKDKVINLIAESWKQDDVRSVEEIKEYFYKQVEVEDE